MTNNACAVCGSIAPDAPDGSSFYTFSGPRDYTRSFRVHAHTPAGGGLSCMDQLVEAALHGRLSIGGDLASKAKTLELALQVSKENPAIAERVLALAEKALA